MMHVIEAGSTAVTIIAEDSRVWIVASVAGAVASAEGMRFGGMFDAEASPPGLESSVRWRPVYERAPCTSEYWLWLKTLVNLARMDAGNRTAREVASVVAGRVRRYLDWQYRNG